jgi:hypothetical protein
MRIVLSGTEKSGRFRGEPQPKTGNSRKVKSFKNWLKKRLNIKRKSHE